MFPKTTNKYGCWTCHYNLYIGHDSMILHIEKDGEYIQTFEIERKHLEDFEILQHRDSDLILEE